VKASDIRIRVSEQLARRPGMVVGAGALLVSLGILAVTAGRSGTEEGDEPLFTVQSGPLTINVSESGRLKNKDEIILKNESERSLKILTLVEEGTVVKKGDIVLELDSANLETARDNNDLNIKRLDSDLTAAQKRREILKNQMQANIEQAEVTLKFARLDLKRFSDGVHPNEVATAEAGITMAQANLERAEQELYWSNKLHEKGYETERTRTADELSAKQQRINLQNLTDARDLLVTYSHPQAVESKESDVKQSEMALQRAKLRSDAELTGQMAELFSLEAQLKEANKELRRAQARLDACTIEAPADGMVVYGTSGGKGREGRELMEVGATVHPMHWLIRMPTSEIMLAMMSVQEATKPKLKEDMAAVVTVDALPGEVFAGKLTKIGILPDSTQAWLNPDLKVYECEVELDSASKQMRPGMNCHVNIVIEEHDNAFFLPMQCVVYVDGKPTVYLKQGGSFFKRVVETGLDNNVMIHILSGLKNGDQVMYNPPLEEAIKKNGTGLPTKVPEDKKATEANDKTVGDPADKSTAESNRLAHEAL